MGVNMKNTFSEISAEKRILTKPNRKKQWNTVLERLKLCVFIILVYLFLSILHIGCPIRLITGISCPGCGMTRAALAVLHLNFAKAFYYHPLIIITPIMLFLFLFEVYINPRLYKAAWIIIIGLFLIVYFLRLLVIHNEVVLIDIDKSIVLRLIHQIHVGGIL
jgi:hypothetical protein